LSNAQSGLPHGWEWAEVGDLLSVRGGYAFKSSAFCDHGIPLIRQGDLGTEEVDVSGAKRLPEYYLDEHIRYAIRQGDLLVGMSGALGKVSEYKESQPALQNQRTGLLKLASPIGTGFARLLMQAVETQIRRKGKGMAVQNVSARDIESCETPVPPAPEQRRIVSKIEELFSELDAGTQALDRAEAKLERYRASVLKAAVGGKLTEQWRSENPVQETGQELLDRILVERRARWEEEQLGRYEAKGKEPPKNWQAKYKEPVGPDTSDLPELPEGWCWTNLDQLTSMVTSGSRGWAKYYADKGRAIFFRIGNVVRDQLRPDMSDIQWVTPPVGAEGLRTAVQEGDLMISITADLGRVAVVPAGIEEGYINQHLALCRPIGGVFGSFVATVLASEPGQQSLLRRDRGVVKAGLGLDDIREVLIPLPPMQEQKEIVLKCERHFEMIDAVRRSLHVCGVRSNATRQSILKRAFEGRLVPQDPDDGPASVLLERIRAQREAEPKKKRRTKKKTPQPEPDL